MRGGITAAHPRIPDSISDIQSPQLEISSHQPPWTPPRTLAQRKAIVSRWYNKSVPRKYDDSTRYLISARQLCPPRPHLIRLHPDVAGHLHSVARRVQLRICVSALEGRGIRELCLQTSSSMRKSNTQMLINLRVFLIPAPHEPSPT